MRIAIVSDIHGNLTALDAVAADINRAKPDFVLHGGDLATSGSQPAEVIDLISQLGWSGVIGNTDEMLWTPEALPELIASAPKLNGLLRVLFEAFAPATRALIGQQRMGSLRRLPTELRHDNLVLLHASPGNLWKAPLDSSDDASLEKVYGNLGASIVVYCHIHRPFIRRLGGLTICNSGSVGAPYDGDPRASYLLIDNGQPAIRRVEYDVEAEVRRLLASDYPYKHWLAVMRRRGTYVPPFEQGNE
jgi:putative phosphoesterase